MKNSYTEIRHNIRSGDLLAWSHRAGMFASWHDFKIAIVRMFTRSEYSHVALAWVIGERVFVLEAVQPLVRCFPLSRLGDFYWLPMNSPWSERAETVALSKIGDAYSEMQAVQAFFAPLAKEDRLWECAEYVLAVLKTDGINLGNMATPTDVILSAQSQGATLNFILNPE